MLRKIVRAKTAELLGDVEYVVSMVLCATQIDKMSRKGITSRRTERIETQIAPLFARGWTQREIAKELGISLSQIQKDCLLIKTTWQEDLEERLLGARAELVFKHDHLYRQCMGAFHAERVPSPKWIELASKELEALGRLLGQAGPSISVTTTQNNVSITADAVGDLFKPLDADSYSKMVAAKVLAPAEGKELPVIEAVVEEVAGSDDWSGAGASVQVETYETHQEKPQGKSRVFHRPLR